MSLMNNKSKRNKYIAIIIGISAVVIAVVVAWKMGWLAKAKAKLFPAAVAPVAPSTSPLNTPDIPAVVA